MGKKIAVIDDEKNIVDILTFNLEKEGYEVLNAYDGEEGLNLIKKENPDLVLLDIMMPKKDGFEVCREVRKSMSVPIIMLTARAEEVDTVLGLELGADDYVTKPFGVRELMARVKANLRRHDSDIASDLDAGAVLRFNELEIYTERYEVLKRKEKIELTPRGYRLLTFLSAQKQKVFSREALLEQVWDFEFYGDVRTVDVTIRRLREKLEDDPGNPEYILTKRGVGYYFDCKNKG